jgi:hypothetical protein
MGARTYQGIGWAGTTRGRRAALLALVIALVTVQLGTAAGAREHKSFTADIGPHVTSGVSQEFTATLVNTSARQQLGSANITPPAGLTLVEPPAPTVAPRGTARIVANVLELRSLSTPPGGSVTATFTAEVSCADVSGSWGVTAKQANNYQGPPGNDLTLDGDGSALSVTVTGACPVAVRFVDGRHPASARYDTTITSVVGNPAGGPVQVEVVDAQGDRVVSSTASISVAIGDDPSAGAATLDGTTSRDAVAGVATFDDLSIDELGTGYTLVASSVGLLSDTSGAFDIWQAGATCAADETCDVTAEQAGEMKVNVKGTAGPNGGTLLVSLTDDGFGCGDPFNHAPYTVIVDDTGIGSKTAVITIAKAVDQLQANNGVAHYQVCYESDVPFTDRAGTPGVTKGLLPDCAPAPQSPTPPCVRSKTKTAGGDVVLTILTETYKMK